MVVQPPETKADRELWIRSVMEALGGAVLAVRSSNTDEWMEYIVHEINRACAAIGDGDRFKLRGCPGQYWIVRSEATGLQDD